MAWSFSDEIHALAGYDADSTSTTVSGETFVVHTNQWLTEGAREVINNLPSNLQKLCTAMQSFTSAAAGSEAETLNTGKVFGVFAGSVNCRSIDNTEKYRAEDSGDVLYATSTDPAYYIESNFINVLPASLSCKYEEVQYPTVANTDTSISVFPDEAEHLVVLYAAMKALQYRMQIKSSDLPSDTELNEVPPDVPTLTSITFSSIDSAVDATLVAAATSTTLGGSSTAPAYDATIGDTEIGEASTALDNEDMELASARLQEAQVLMQQELSEFNQLNIAFQAGVQEAMAEFQSSNQIAIGNAERSQNRQLQNSTNDMQAIVQNNQSLISKYTAESSAYSAGVNAQVQEFTTKIQKHTADYQWLQGQYASLKADYVAGLTALKGT